MATTFRSDIQGLRAVAVLVVLASHAGLPYFEGGFIGVDVFFVISGFLISSLLFAEVADRESVSLRNFWARRARRILPAATLVTVVTVVASMFLLSFIDARRVFVDSLWSTAFAANVHFAQQDLSYFEQSSSVSPMQHYWSLAVEEQFYLVWPLLVLAVAVTARRRKKRAKQGLEGPRPLPRFRFFVLLAIISGVSIAWSIYQSAAVPESAYFSTLTRAWELGAGAMIALVTPAAASRIGRKLATAMGLVGATAIVVACVDYSEATNFPSWPAALPVLGTVLLLAAGMSPHRPVTHGLLTAGVMQRIGDWSFSLYLWHWPVLILSARWAERPLTWSESTVAVGASFFLAAATFTFVEQPFRTGVPAKKLSVPFQLLLYPVSAALVAAVAVAGWQWTGYQLTERGNNPPITVAGGADGPADDPIDLVRASVEAARDDSPVPSDLSPDLINLPDSIADVGDCDYTETDVRTLCPRGDEDGEKTLVVIGDSHARAWIPAFERITDGWTAYYLVKSQCTAARLTIAPLNDDEPFTECSDFQSWVSEQVEALNPDLVVVTSSPPVNGVFVDDVRVESIEAVSPALAEGYDILFKDLLEKSERVVLLSDVPKSSNDPGSCLSTRKPSLQNCLFEPLERSRVLGDVAVQSAQLAGAEVVDPTPWLCLDDDCPVVIGGTLSYRDASHLTTEYAELLAPPLAQELDLPQP